jgi:hypothetical protein
VSLSPLGPGKLVLFKADGSGSSSHLRIICVARNGDRCLEDLIEAAIQEEEDADSDSDLDECASPWRELRMP